RVYPGQSIQKAIDRAKPGDRIEVEGGTYYERLTITTDGIQLVGKKGATLKPPTKAKSNVCSGLAQTLDGKSTEAGICIHGKDIKLLPYVFEHRKIESVGKPVKNVSVSGFTIIGFDGENIAAVGTENVKVFQNKLVNGGRYGFLSVAGKGSRAWANDISTVDINFIAMCMDDYSDAVFSENKVDGYFTGLCAQTPGGVYTKNTVTNVCVGSAADPGIKGAKIIDNFFSTRRTGCEKIYGAGVVVFGAVETVVKKNYIEKFKNDGLGVGIFLTNGYSGEVATGNIVTENKLVGNDFDIYDNSTGVNTLQKNVCA
ncbi:pectin lyase-like protein, partial [Aaosphaeria arxii CBS 175.79]